MIRALFGSVGVPGFATLVLMVTFFGGMTLLAIGVVGEYVARIVSETTRPPRYIVRRTTTDPGAAPTVTHPTIPFHVPHTPATR